MKKGVVLGMIICFGITSIHAQSNKERRKKPPTFEQLLEKMDENEDGKLSKSEVKGPLKNDFTIVDTDEDGYITKEELEKAPKSKRKECAHKK